MIKSLHNTLTDDPLTERIAFNRKSSLMVDADISYKLINDYYLLIVRDPNDGYYPSIIMQIDRVTTFSGNYNIYPGPRIEDLYKPYWTYSGLESPDHLITLAQHVTTEQIITDFNIYFICNSEFIIGPFQLTPIELEYLKTHIDHVKNV